MAFFALNLLMTAFQLECCRIVIKSHRIPDRFPTFGHVANCAIDFEFFAVRGLRERMDKTNQC